MTQLYEIRNAETNWLLMKPGTERDVSKFWADNKPTESKTRKISGVIVIYVTFDREKETCASS